MYPTVYICIGSRHYDFLVPKHMSRCCVHYSWRPKLCSKSLIIPVTIKINDGDRLSMKIAVLTSIRELAEATGNALKSAS